MTIEKIDRNTITLTSKDLRELLKIKGIITKIDVDDYTYKDKEDEDKTKRAYHITLGIKNITELS